MKPLRTAHPSIGAAIVFLGIMTLGGCSKRPAEDLENFMPAPSGFSRSGAAEQPTAWWTAFEEPELNRLVETALESELTLRSVWERLRAARAVVDRESSFLFPELEGFADGVDTTGSSRAGNSRLELGLTAFYEVDLWGRIRSAVDAERYRADASFADYQTVAISLSAEVTRTWVQLMELYARIDLLENQIETNEKLARQLRNQFGAGQVRSVDVLRQDQLVAATRQQQSAAEASLGLLENRLAILLGRPAQNGAAVKSRGLPKLPTLPDTGVPADLVQRRPDVQSAFLQLQAADKDVASAVSDQFPRLTLAASFSTEHGGAEELFDNWMRSLAGNLAAPLIEAGRRRAEVERTKAIADQRLYEYGQSVLIAFQDVEDALVQEAKQREQIRQLEEQVDLAKKTSDQLLVEYTNGVSDFIDLLTALTDEQRLRRDLLFANRVLLEFRIALYRALAGGLGPPRNFVETEG